MSPAAQVTRLRGDPIPGSPLSLHGFSVERITRHLQCSLWAALPGGGSGRNSGTSDQGMGSILSIQTSRSAYGLREELFSGAGPCYMDPPQGDLSGPSLSAARRRIGQCLPPGGALAIAFQGVYLGYHSEAGEAFLFCSESVPAYCAVEHSR